jgi:hypothetical protein
VTAITFWSFPTCRARKDKENPADILKNYSAPVGIASHDRSTTEWFPWQIKGFTGAFRPRLRERGAALGNTSCPLKLNRAMRKHRFSGSKTRQAGFDGKLHYHASYLA